MSNDRRAVILASVLMYAGGLSAVEYGNIAYRAISGTNDYELWSQNWAGFYTILETRYHIMLNYDSTACWLYHTETYYDPPMSIGAYSITKAVSDYYGLKVPWGYTIQQPLTLVKSYAGANPPPTATQLANMTAPTGVGYLTGKLTETGPGDDGQMLKSITNVGPCLFLVGSPDNIPQPLTANVYSMGRLTNIPAIQHYGVDYSTLRFTWSAPSSGLWELVLMTLSRMGPFGPG